MDSLLRVKMRCRSVVDSPEGSTDGVPNRKKQQIILAMDVDERKPNYPTAMFNAVMSNPEVFDKLEYGVEYNIDISKAD